jgi:hypothetical protein
MVRLLIAAIVGGVLGGIAAASLVVRLAPGAAARPPASATSVSRQQIVAADRIELRDASGKVRAELAMSVDGGPALFFFDRAGRNRMVLGLYSPAEGEAPSVVLNDLQERAAAIVRLFGSRDAPVVVLKSQGRDRSVYGLNPISLDPFLANYAGDGTKSDVFGRY